MKPKGWRRESRRHSMARKGISTNIDGDRRFDVSNFVSRGKHDPLPYGFYEDETRSRDNQLVIVDVRDGYVIGGHISDEDWWEDDKTTIVDPFIMKIEDFELQPMVLLSEGSTNKKKISKWQMDDLKTIDKLFKESTDFEMKATYEILKGTGYVQDVAIAYNQIYDNVRHTDWFKRAVKTEMESDYEADKRWKELKEMK